MRMREAKHVWQCPFFSYSQKLVIRCEGARLLFRSRAALREYQDQYCANLCGWEACTIARELKRQYEKEDARGK